MKREDLANLGIEDAELVQKLMDLHGKSTESIKGELGTLKAQNEQLTSQLTEANKNLEGYDPEWKTKAEQAEREAQTKIEKVKYDMFAEKAVSGLKFSSKSARDAFASQLIEKALPIENDQLLGLNDFVESYKSNDPEAFITEEKPPRFTGSTEGSGKEALKGNEAVNDAFRTLFKGDK